MEVFHKVFKCDLCQYEVDMDITKFIRCVIKQINLAMFDMGSRAGTNLDVSVLEANSDQHNKEDREIEDWTKGKQRTYYDAIEIQKELEEMETFRPKNLISIIASKERQVIEYNSEFLQNGLLKVTHYYSFLYLPEIEHFLSFPITYYNYLKDFYESLPRKFNLHLTIHDFICLNHLNDEHNFITDSLMNIYTLILLKFYELENVVTVFDVRQSSCVFQNKKNNISFLRFPTKINQYLIIPFLKKQGHWVFFLVDTLNDELHYINPSSNDCQSEETQEFFEKCKLLLKKIKLSNSNWNISQYLNADGCVQNSGFNVLMYIENIFEQLHSNIAEITYSYKTTLYLFKKYMRNDLIANSERVDIYCIKCGTKNPSIAKNCRMCLKICCIHCQESIIDNVCIICKSCFVNK